MRERIKDRSAVVVVIGAGYVGLPLAQAASAAGFATTTYDTDAVKVRAINAEFALTASLLDATADPRCLDGADVVIVCVPTPLNKTREPDNSYVMDAIGHVIKAAPRERLVVLESTTFPGFTREVLLPLFEARGEPFHLAFSPERTDPGNTNFGLANTPKIVSGVTVESCDLAALFYRTFVDRVVPVSSTGAAEMTKLLENTFRQVNIALVNEVAVMCHQLGLDVWEVIEAAATKPFGFTPFTPGPGVGGHCIGLDPLYLSWKMRTLGYRSRMIEAADEINSSMPEHVVRRVGEILNVCSKSIAGAYVALVGVAYKANVSDVRESPALDVWRKLARQGARLSYYDPWVPELRVGDETHRSGPIASCDVAIVLTDHTGTDYAGILKASRTVLDCRNAVRRVHASEKIVPL